MAISRTNVAPDSRRISVLCEPGGVNLLAQVSMACNASLSLTAVPVSAKSAPRGELSYPQTRELHAECHKSSFLTIPAFRLVLFWTMQKRWGGGDKR